MYKLVDSASFFKQEEGQVTILDLSTPSEGLEKAAADSRINEYVSRIQPKPGMCYLHINAMGAGEYYGSNRNGDYFPEANLIEHHKTFETSPAHLFRHHINKDPAKANGKVIFSIYNERMHRVELIVEADKSLVQDIESRIAMGDFPATSMACKTPYDVCSICGNKAHSRDEYCSHIKTELNKIYPDGRRVMALNIGPLRFFDISIVIRPADVTSSVLQKVANEQTLSSAEIAILEGLEEREKSAEMKKISELVKEVTGGLAVGYIDKLNPILRNVKDLPEELAYEMKDFPLHETFSEMASLGISPSIAFLSELIALKTLGSDYKGIGSIVEDYLRVVDKDSLTPITTFEPVADSNPYIRKILLPHLDGSSLFPEYIEKRASGVGYFGLGPRVEPTVEEEMARLALDTPVEKVDNFITKYGKLLLGIGGAALLAKLYISTQIENKLREDRNRVKISIVKKASDYKLAADLSRASVVKPDEQNPESSNMTQRLISKLVKSIFRNRISPDTADKLTLASGVVGVASKIN